MNVELLWVGARREVAHDLTRADVENLHRIVVACTDEKIFAVLGEHDPARALPDWDGLLDLECCAVEHRDRVAFLVGDVDGVGRRRPRGDYRANQHDCGPEALHAPSHIHPPHWSLHLLSGSSMPSVSTSAYWCRNPCCGDIDTGRSGPAMMMGCRS